MTTQAFLESPWEKSHPVHAKSAFNIRPAPETATGEIILSSLYRNVGLEGITEQSVPKAGREFESRTNDAGFGKDVASAISPETWRTVLHGALESPKRPNQSSKRFLQLCPIVPDTAIYSGSARLVGNSWNPGQLVQRMVLMGSASSLDAAGLWERLFLALGVGTTDDIWARWVGEEFARRKTKASSWALRKLEEFEGMPDAEKPSIAYPAKQFVTDLDSIMEAKDSMTRRQWLSLLESLLRIGTVSHVLWLADLNAKLWERVRMVLEGNRTGVTSQGEILAEVISCSQTYLSYENPAIPRIRELTQNYLNARLGINLVLWELEALGRGVPSLDSVSDVEAFIATVDDCRPEMLARDVQERFALLQDRETRSLSCKKGIGSNMVEFCSYALGQRVTANPALRGYDQGYALRKRGSRSTGPWVLSLGPVSVLALVHCCLRGAIGPRSVKKLTTHLAAYGIKVDREDIASGDLGRQLRMLGLILDSPDAETGMLLVAPFSERMEQKK